MADLSPRGLWALARHAVVFELRLYRSLFRWVTRRHDIPEHAEPFGYAQAVTPVMWLWIFASAAEIPLIHVLVPWDAVRVAGLVVGVWGLVWMVGLLASLRVYPHLLDDVGLRVRHGASTDIALPWNAIAAVRAERRDLPSSVWTLQPRETADGGTALQVGVSGQVNVHAVLHRPTAVRTAKGDLEISELSFLVDDPRELVTRARQHLARVAEPRQP